MINQDFIIDFDQKKIVYRGNGKKIYPALDLYSYLQDTFDEPENLQYEIPITAQSKDKFTLINGWTLDPAGLKFLRGQLTTTPQ